MKPLILSFIFLLGMASFANEPFRIIGKNDLVGVNAEATNIPSRYKNIVDAFGVMNIECTGTHIGNGYVLTAGHCFWAGPDLAEGTACPEVTIAWGIRGLKKPYMISQCLEVIAKQKSDFIDFAIIKVFPIPEVFISPDMNRRAIIGDSLTIFSYPHELPLQWSKQCGFERELNTELAQTTAIRHRCDTSQGSSGAVLLNVLSLKIVGIHNGGVVDDDGHGMNYASFITDAPLFSVLKHLGFK